MRPLLFLPLLFAPLALAADAAWTLEPEARGTGGVPDAYVHPDGRAWLYWCNPQGIARADVLDNGTLGPLSVVRIDGGPRGCDPTVVALPNGSYRMYYKVAQGQGGPDQAKHTIHAATGDGLNFTYDRMVIETRSDGRYVSVPDALVLPDGRVRLYYVSAEAVKSHLSTDASWLTFAEESGQRMAGENAHVDPEVVLVGDTWILFVSSRDFTGARPPPQYLAYGIGTDAFNFTFHGFMTKEIDAFDPTLVMLPDGRARIYLGTLTNELRSVISAEPFQPEEAVASPTPTSSPTPAASPTPTVSPEQPDTTATPVVQPTPTPSPEPTPPPRPTPFPSPFLAIALASALALGVRRR